MRTQKRRDLSRKILSFLLTLAMVFGLIPYAIPAAEAAAVTSFTLCVTDKAGVDQAVGTWNYDSGDKTFKDGNGTEAPFVKTFTGDDVLRYSGKDMFTAARMAVCTKGILLSDLLTYASNAAGIPLNDNTTVKTPPSMTAYPYSTFLDRYYYPSYITGQEFDDTGKVAVSTVLAVYSYNQRNLAGSANQGWGSATKLTALNGGVEVPVATDEASLEHAFNILTLGADDDRSLRLLLGQNEDSPGDLNLGRMSTYNVTSVIFTPEYLDIAVSVTDDDGGQATATVATADGYAKATAGESVSFTVSDITPGYRVDTVSVSYGEAGTVDVSETSGVYSFTMPDAAATINVSLTAASASTYNITIDGAISGGTVAVEPASGSEGTTVTVTVTPETGKRLVAGSLKYTTDGGGSYTPITETGGVCSFVLPAANVTLTAQFEDQPAASLIWDGSVDVSWYNPTDTTFYLSTPAQLAGLAAIVNGIYNTGATVTGNANYIVYNVGGGTVKDATTNTWIYGGDDFDGKTVYLTADLDMGGVYSSATGTWSGPNYMPIGGQYCMTYQDGTTLIGASWNGAFDGQGHTVKNIYCSRHAGSLGYAFSQSIGLIGRMGVHDNDPVAWYASPSIKNVAVTGYIYGNRSIGGIVGKNGRSTASVIENCINYASVSNTDSKGVGGIAGAGWNKLTIKNCANFGSIYTSYSNAGGISGSCEAKVFNSYNVGYVGASSANQAQSLGTNNGGAVWTNCYWLDGSSASNQAVYGSTTGSTITNMPTADSMKTADFLAALNGDGRAWVADTHNINNGYPILAWQGTAAPATYTVAVDGSITGGSLTVNPASGAEGDTVNVTVTPDSGKQLVAGSLKYTADSGSTYTEIAATDDVYSFTLPGADVVVTAQFGDLPTEDKTPPALTADATGNTVGQAVYLSFTDDEAWRNAISGITVNGTALTGEQYTVSAGRINLAAGVFSAAGDYTVTVTASGYSDATVTQTMNEATAGYTVTFVSDGTTYTTQTAASGATMEAPADPAKDSYTFGGWYTDETWTTAVSFPYTVTGDVMLYAKWTPAPAGSPKYTVAPAADASVYEVGATPGGISTMTVKTGVTGLKYFGVQVTPVIAHEGQESVVFVHVRNGAQQSLNVTRADFDTVQTALAGFNVQPGDVVEVYIVDELTSETDFNPTILQ